MSRRAIATLLLLAATSGCTSMLPMTHGAFAEKDVGRVAQATGLPEEVVRDTTIHVVEEQRMGCFQMVKKCWAGVKWYMKAIGSVPLACTELWQIPDGTKKAIIYSCWWTDPVTMAHERKHAEGEGHAYW